LLKLRRKKLRVCYKSIKTFVLLSYQLYPDFDPEEDSPGQGSNEDNASGESEDDLAGTEHYVDVGYVKAAFVIS
jgi:hypothetical protein